jgi:hypothetical protein
MQGYVKVRFIEYHSKNIAKYFWRNPMNQTQYTTASGQQNIRAIAQWSHLHTATLRAALPALTSLPSVDPVTHRAPD